MPWSDIARSFPLAIHPAYSARPDATLDRRSITADTALRIAKALGTTPKFWLNLQRMYDLDIARAKTNLDDIVPLVDASA